MMAIDILPSQDPELVLSLVLTPRRSTEYLSSDCGFGWWNKQIDQKTMNQSVADEIISS